MTPQQEANETTAAQPVLYVVENGRTIEKGAGAAEQNGEQPASALELAATIAATAKAAEATDAATDTQIAPAPKATRRRVAPRLSRPVVIGGVVLLLAAGAAVAGMTLLRGQSEFARAVSAAGDVLQQASDDTRALDRPGELNAYVADIGRSQEKLEAAKDAAARSLDGSERQRALEVYDASAAWLGALEDVAGEPRAKVGDDTFSGLDSAEKELDAAAKAAEAGGDLDVSSTVLRKVKRQHAEQFRTERDDREAERRTILSQNSELRRERSEVNAHAAAVRSGIADYQKSRTRTGEWSRYITQKPWVMVNLYDFEDLASQIQERQSIRDRIAGRATTGPDALDAPTREIVRVLDTAISGTQDAYTGLEDTVSGSTPYTNIMQTPAWDDFLSASKVIDTRLPAASSGFSKAVQRELKKLKDKPLPPRITE